MAHLIVPCSHWFQLVEFEFQILVCHNRCQNWNQDIEISCVGAQIVDVALLDEAAADVASDVTVDVALSRTRSGADKHNTTVWAVSLVSGRIRLYCSIRHNLSKETCGLACSWTSIGVQNSVG